MRWEEGSLARVLGMVCSGREVGYTATLLIEMVSGAAWAEYLELQMIGAVPPRVYRPLPGA